MSYPVLAIHAASAFIPALRRIFPAALLSLCATALLCGCALVNPVVADIDYQPQVQGGLAKDKGKIVVLAGADMRRSKSLAADSGFSPAINKVRMQGESALLAPHEALRAALKTRLEARGYAVQETGSEGTGLVACLYAFEEDSPLPDIRRAHVAFSLVAVKSSAIAEQKGETLGFAEALKPCAASVGMATSAKGLLGESLDFAFSEALGRAVDGVDLGACLR